jgi:hypothetical protein
LVTPYAEHAVPFKTLLLFIDTRKVIPYPPQVRKSRFGQEMQELPVGPFGRMDQPGVGIFDRCDGTE